MNALVKLRAPEKIDEPMVAGQPGTLLQHGTKYDDDASGKTFRTFTTGPIKGREDYSVDKHGSLRHTYPHFRGSKKARKRLKALLIKAHDQTSPIGHRELTQVEKLEKLDVILNVETGKWQYTHLVGCTVKELRLYYPLFSRAARMMELAKKVA